LDVHCLRREHHEIALAGVLRIGRGVELDGAVARGAFQAQAVAAHRLDVLAPGVDRPDFVAGGGEQPGVHRAHRTGSDDGDLHC
jgi:hypothetical protein